MELAILVINTYGSVIQNLEFEIRKMTLQVGCKLLTKNQANLEYFVVKQIVASSDMMSEVYLL